MPCSLRPSWFRARCQALWLSCKVGSTNAGGRGRLPATQEDFTMNKNALAPAVLLLSMGFTLAGCQTRGDVRPFSSEVPPPPQFVALAEKCNANDARFALGQKITPP